MGSRQMASDCQKSDIPAGWVAPAQKTDQQQQDASGKYWLEYLTFGPGQRAKEPECCQQKPGWNPRDKKWQKGCSLYGSLCHMVPKFPGRSWAVGLRVVLDHSFLTTALEHQAGTWKKSRKQILQRTLVMVRQHGNQSMCLLLAETSISKHTVQFL